MKSHVLSYRSIVLACWLVMAGLPAVAATDPQPVSCYPWSLAAACANQFLASAPNSCRQDNNGDAGKSGLPRVVQSL
jgi:hypothetical protein